MREDQSGVLRGNPDGLGSASLSTYDQSGTSLRSFISPSVVQQQQQDSVPRQDFMCALSHHVCIALESWRWGLSAYLRLVVSAKNGMLFMNSLFLSTEYYYTWRGGTLW